MDSAAATIQIDKTGKPRLSVRAGHKLAMPAPGNPELKVALSEEGEFSGSVTVAPANLTPHGLSGLKVTGGGTLTLANGHLSGRVDGLDMVLTDSGFNFGRSGWRNGVLRWTAPPAHGLGAPEPQYAQTQQIINNMNRPAFANCRQTRRSRTSAPPATRVSGFCISTA